MKNSSSHCFFLSLFMTIGIGNLMAVEPNYDESKVPEYTLPELLRSTNGNDVRTAEEWESRRKEIFELFQTHVYGRTPTEQLSDINFQLREQGDALSGRAIRKQVRINFTKDGSVHADLLLLIPKRATKPVPVFLGLNFSGNHAVHSDPKIEINAGWSRSTPNHKADPKDRGKNQGRWQPELLVENGYALATIYCGDLDPDKYVNGFSDGVHPLFYRDGQTKPEDDEWGSIGAWAWGLSRALDYLETEEDIDSKKVAVIGHSRLGKTALWAGANDERFALVISNNSGCGGAALFRRCYGERVHVMAQRFPDWFCVNYQKYAERENEMPVDQHMLIALMAPRPVYVASAVDDKWADPRGEFLAAKHASPAYSLFEKTGLPAEDMPEINSPVHGTIGYHIRSGKHDVTRFDWEQYIAFADKHFDRN